MMKANTEIYSGAAIFVGVSLRERMAEVGFERIVGRLSGGRTEDEQVDGAHRAVERMTF